MALPRKLSGVAVYIEGVSYIGQAEFTPPNIAASVEESNMPGHGGSFDIPTGRLEKMDAEVRVMDVPPELAQLVANPNSVNTDVVFISTMTDGVNAQRVEKFTLRGVWREQNREAVGAGDNNVQVTFAVNVRVLTHEIDSAEVRHIDLEQDIHRIGGTDVNEARRTALRS